MNRQMNGNWANTNNELGDGTINHDNDNLSTRLSNTVRLGNIRRIAAGAALGLSLAIVIALPSAAGADAPLVSSANYEITPTTFMGFLIINGSGLVDRYANLALDALRNASDSLNPAPVSINMRIMAASHRSSES